MCAEGRQDHQEHGGQFPEGSAWKVAWCALLGPPPTCPPLLTCTASCTPPPCLLPPPQFRYLSRLLLVHGRWTFLRNREIVCYSFYKNWAYVLTYVYLQCWAGFSSQPIFTTMMISTFNMIFTALPVGCYGIVEQVGLPGWAWPARRRLPAACLGMVGQAEAACCPALAACMSPRASLPPPPVGTLLTRSPFPRLLSSRWRPPDPPPPPPVGPTGPGQGDHHEPDPPPFPTPCRAHRTWTRRPS